MKKLLTTMLSVAALSATFTSDSMAHGHIDAGTTNSGSELYLYNVYDLETILTPTYADYLANGGGQTQARIESLLNAGYDYIFEVTFTAIGPINPAIGIELGSFIQLQLVGITGPGNFAFWESSPQTSPPAWTANSSYDFANGPTLLIDLTSAAWVGQDPAGHRHNRRYGVDAPGLYTLEWQVIDREGHYLPSQSFFMNFHAIPEPSTLGLLAAGGLVAYLGLRRRKEQP